LCLSAVLVFPAAIAGAQDAKSEQYASLLAQIADKKVALMQQELFAANQQKEIEFLRGQIAGVNEIKGDVDGVIEKMVAQMERAVTADLPFQREERLNRIAKLRNDLDDDSLKVGDKYRLALSALKIEVNYGMSVEDYDGERPLNDGETVGELRFALAHLDDDGVPKENPLTLKPYEESREQGTFLRYGRVALVYMDDRMGHRNRKEDMLKISIAKGALLASGLAGLVLATPAQAQLDQALQTAKRSTAQSAASQQRVADLDDSAEAKQREYRAVLQQIDNIRLFVDQQDIYLQSQQSEIDSLNDQLGTVEAIKQGMSPMMLRMAVKIEDAINADMPFLKEQRLARVQRLKNTLGDPAVSPAEQYRQVLNLYKQEVSFGQGLESYEGAHPSKANSIVNYLRYGRVSLVSN